MQIHKSQKMIIISGKETVKTFIANWQVLQRMLHALTAGL